MASSSSSFHSTPPTSWKYDVFLSFRGTDTRYVFVDHLYAALKQQGIGTFKDDEELPRGETIRPALLKAIEDSQIAVVVFSENYAESSWCLQELEYIMKCKVERYQIVIPIFYQVDPSEVRKHESKYGEALAKHESEKKNVETWRKALFDAGNLSGYVPNGPETTFIKNIVKDISKRLRLAIPSDSEDLIGMEDRLEDVKSMLAMDSVRVVMMVGIWGLGGGGKTTLARALYDEISIQFDGCCFVKNIRNESRKHGLEELQKQIISPVLNIKKEDADANGDAGDLIKTTLCRKKVLLVLDDVDDADQLKALAGSPNWFKEGSRIIITTRDQHVLNTHRVKAIYNIVLLSDEEAMKLFHKHALWHHNHIEDYDTLSKEVVFCAGRLPLALKVLGEFLGDKDRSEWVSALASLKRIPSGDIVKQLKISYDGLEPHVKELFLEIACFFRRDVSGDESWAILEACGFDPKIWVRVLTQKALITVTEEGIFDMHDLIQEMGHYIVREKYPRNPEKHRRVWRREDVVTICALPLEENHWIEALKIWRSDEQAGWTWERGDVPRNLPHVVANMKELRWFSCYEYPAASLPINFQSTKLCYLRLESRALKQLWEGEKDLPYLKVLDLSICENLISTPDFHRLPCLERIKLTRCEKLTYVHPSIGYHETLVSVEMPYCRSLKTFPPINKMKKLETLLLFGCSNLSMFPEIQMKMDNMKELSLARTGIKVVPSSIGKYCTNLLSLDFRGCENLESIEGNFHLLKHLKKFYINECSKEIKIPAEGLFNVTCCLETLDLSATSFKNLHPDITSIKFLDCPHSLRKLSVAGRYSINRDISSVLSKLSNLQELDLHGSDFSGLHCSLLQLPCLKYLDLSYCDNLIELPDLPSSIAMLKAYGCKKLKIVDLPTNLKWLRRITLPMESILGDVERKVQSMLQRNAIKDYSISLCFHGANTPKGESPRRRLMLELPRNWDDEFSGFLICIKPDVHNSNMNDVIAIEDVTNRENEDVWGVYDEALSLYLNNRWMCYIYLSFGSLRHTSWWKSTHTNISFSIQNNWLQKVELVPRRSKGDSIERLRVHTTNSSEFWDKEPVEIIDDSKSCVKINWHHENIDSMDWDRFIQLSFSEFAPIR